LYIKNELKLKVMFIGNNPFVAVNKTYSFIPPDLEYIIRMIGGIILIVVALMFIFLAIIALIKKKEE
jgi:hypothetical protein